MRRVLFDTNIYGRIVENKDLRFVAKTSEGLIKICGSVIVNKELRGYEGKAVLEFEGKTRKLKSLLFEAYYELVKDHIYPVDANVERLAEGYFVAYKKFGGKKERSQIFNDFLIVATASLHRLEIIYSDDSKTMKSLEAKDAYELVNSMNDLAPPNFKSYEELKKELKLRRWSF